MPTAEVPDEKGGPSSTRVLLITGVASGIGREIALHFGSRGWAVAGADIDRAGGEAWQNQPGPQARLFIEIDVRREEQIEALIRRAVERFGRIDCLCNNAGIEFFRRADLYTTTDWDKIQEINLRGPFLCSKHAFPYLKETAGSIIHISSIQAFANEPHLAGYVATKAGLLGLTRSLALDFAPWKVRVNSICPGAIRTAMMTSFLQAQSDPRAAEQQMKQTIPLLEMGDPLDIAHAAYFLASPEARYITGAHLTVDGGLLARLA